MVSTSSPSAVLQILIISVLDPTKLDADTQSEGDPDNDIPDTRYYVKIYVRDPDEPGFLEGTYTTLLQLIDFDDAPEFDSANFTSVDLIEGATTGMVISGGTPFKFVDVDLSQGDRFSYAFEDGSLVDPLGVLQIDPDTGILSVKDSSPIDFETNPTLDVSVEVDDSSVGADPDDAAEIRLRVVDVVELVVDGSSVTVNEGQAAVQTGTITASSTVTLAASLGTAVIHRDGTWTWTLDTTDGSDDSGQVTIRSVDSTGASISTEVQFSLTVNPVAPTVSPATFTISENVVNGKEVGVVTATDAGQDAFTFGVSAGNDSGAFKIDLTTGLITVADSSKLDFETTPSYALAVQATDDELTGSATITIHLSNVNEVPSITDQIFAVSENAVADDVVGNVIASDPDAGDVLTWSMIDDSDTFQINSATGQITVLDASSLDFETKPQYQVTVIAHDAGDPQRSDSATMTIDLIDGNDAPNVQPDTFTVAENATNAARVGAVIASDPNSDDLSYAIVGSQDLPFAIDSELGVITVTDSQSLDFESTPSYSFTVQVTDSGTPALSTTAVITIDVVSPELISAVKVGSTAWTDLGLLATVDPANQQGYQLVTDADETIPWSNVDLLHVKFSEDISSRLDEFTFLLQGVDVADYQFVGTPQFDSATLTLTLTLASALDTDKLCFRILDAGNAEVHQVHFSVLPGDINNDGTTSVADIGPLRDAIGYFAEDAGYNMFADLDGSGAVSVADIGPLRSHIGLFLPDGDPCTDSNVPGQSITLNLLSTDTNGDGLVSPIDALLVINHLNSQTTSPSASLENAHLDINRDGLISPIDVLLVINEINAQASAEGEFFGAGELMEATGIALPRVKFPELMLNEEEFPSDYHRPSALPVATDDMPTVNHAENHAAAFEQLEEAVVIEFSLEVDDQLLDVLASDLADRPKKK